MKIKPLPLPSDFNRFKISPKELQELMRHPKLKPIIEAKITELRTLYKAQIHSKADPQIPATLLDIPETAFLLSAKILELKATFPSLLPHPD